MARKLYEICMEIRKEFKPLNYAAKPYLEAMECLDHIGSNYGADSGKSCVLYFLANASSFKGEAARRIKKELKDMAGVK